MIAMFFACGQTTDESNYDTKFEVEEIVEDDGALPEEDMAPSIPYVPENIDGKWQIDDYAEMVMGGKIYNSTDDIPEDQMGMYFYYEIKNIKDGYVKVTGAYEGWSELAVWRMKDGNDLVGQMSAGCGPVCDYSNLFQVYNKENLINDNAESEVLPMDEISTHKEKMYKMILDTYPNLEYPDDVQLRFNIPSSTTSMRVDIIVGSEEVELPLLNLSWDKEKFSVQEYYEDIKGTNY
jgi:hypothetical protein